MAISLDDMIQHSFTHLNDALDALFNAFYSSMADAASAEENSLNARAEANEPNEQASALNQALTAFQTAIFSIIDHPKNTNQAQTFQKILIEIQTLNQKHPDAICHMIASAVLTKVEAAQQSLNARHENINQDLIWDGFASAMQFTKTLDTTALVLLQFRKYVEDMQPTRQSLTKEPIAQNEPRTSQTPQPSLRGIISRIISQFIAFFLGYRTAMATPPAPPDADTQSLAPEPFVPGTRQIACINPNNRTHITNQLHAAKNHPKTPINKSNIFYTAVNPQIPHQERQEFVEQVCEELADDSTARVILSQIV